MEKIVLESISVCNTLVEYHYSYSSGIKKYFQTDCMFLEYEEDMSDIPLSILTISFVNCIAGLMWLSNCMVFVDEIDETYYYSLKQIKNSFHELHNYIELKGLLVPSHIVRNTISSSNDSVLLFGGGADCHSSFLRNRDKVSHIININGWLKSISEENSVDKSDKRHAAEYAQSMNITSSHVRSNFASQFDLSAIDKDFKKSVLHTSYWYGFLHPMAFLAIATPVAWKRNISNIMIASSFTKGRTNVHCASYITTDSEYRFAVNGVTLHDAFEMSRQDKIAYIVNYQKRTEQPYFFQACSFNDHNCCECEKCFRTIIELVAENADPRDFGFDIQGSLTKHWQKILERDVSQWGVKKESFYYELAARRMRENYQAIRDKEFVDWFLSIDFNQAKRNALRRYYLNNFFPIIKRKLKIC